MIVTFVCGEDMFSTEAGPHTELEPLLTMAQIELRSLSSFSFQQLGLVYNGKQASAVSVLKKTIQELQLKDGDVVYILPIQPTAAPAADVATTSSAAKLQSVFPEDKAKRLCSLISSIKVPGAARQAQTLAQASQSQQLDPRQMEARILPKYRKMMKDLFDKMAVSRPHQDMLHGDSPELYEVWTKTKDNFEAFFAEAVKFRDEMERRERLAVQDPTSVEGQKYIADLIRRQNIIHNEKYAIDNLPEAVVPVTMLYIPLNINGNDVMAFVDTGAQVSIMSEACAKRCNLERLLDRRYKMVAVGIGGTQKFVGRLHSCEVRVNDHVFDCQFNVAADRNMDLLIGLDVMKRHNCCVDLDKNVLRFKDGTEATFLTEDAIKNFNAVHKTGVGADAAPVHVDSEKVAQLVGMGFDAEEAAAALKRQHNDIEEALNSLYARREAEEDTAAAPEDMEQ